MFGCRSCSKTSKLSCLGWERRSSMVYRAYGAFGGTKKFGWSSGDPWGALRAIGGGAGAKRGGHGGGGGGDGGALYDWLSGSVSGFEVGAKELDPLDLWSQMSYCNEDAFLCF